jgi:hypothetical protein
MYLFDCFVSTFCGVFFFLPYSVLFFSSSESEDKFYTKCHELGITTISIGHRPSLLKHHENIYEISGRKLILKSMSVAESALQEL